MMTNAKSIPLGPQWILIVAAIVALHNAANADDATVSGTPAAGDLVLHFEECSVDKEEPAGTVQLQYADSPVDKRPVILMLGRLDRNEPPFWSHGLLADGYVLAAFHVAHPPDPDPNRRPVWLYFDQRFAHSYVVGGARAPADAGRIIDFLEKRDDIATDKIGWMGSSSTGIPGLSVAVREPRLAAIVAFVSTGAYEQWLESWHTNQLWKGETDDLWPETRDLLKHDPIRHVESLFPTAVLMVSGGNDKVVDPATAQAFVDAARPYYATDPDRLRLALYHGSGHNLPRDVVTMYTQHWFRTYLHPVNPPPAPVGTPKGLDESVKRTQINARRHEKLFGNETGE